MDVDELLMPIIGLQCTLLAIFFVVAFPHTLWVWLSFLLVVIGTVFTIGWAVAPRDSDGA